MVGAVPSVQTGHLMTQLDIELAALRTRRAPRFNDRIRQIAAFDRRAIREPGERDIYWTRVQQRLSESDYASLTRHRASEPPARPSPLVG